MSPAQIVPLRYLARIDPGKSEVKHLPDDLEVDFIPMEAVGHGGRLHPAETRRLGEVRDGYTYLRSGDVSFAKISPSFQNRKGGRAEGLTNGLAFATTELTILRPEPTADARFLQYVVESEPFIQHGAATLHGVAGQQRVDLSRVAAFPVWSPGPDTQRRIADMLDVETARIDTLIEKNERVLDLLERRRLSVVVAAVCGDRSDTSSSGHETGFWLGSMPREWVVAALGYRYDVQLGKMLSAERRESGDQRPYLANVDVQWDRFNVDGLRTMDLSDEEWPRYGVEPGDVLICEGGDIGRSAVWPIDGPSGIHFQKALHRARPLDPAEDNPRWLYYAMLAAAKTGVFQFGAEASTIDHLTGERLREHRFPFPPRDEQDRLVADLDQAIAKIDSLRVKVDRQQELLRLRHQALITAAVAGEIEV